MKLAFKLAYRNLMGAGLRTWLNVGVLAFVFLFIIFVQGFMNGWYQESQNESVAWQYGHGQLLNEEYDPYDAFTVQDGHGVLSTEKSKNLTPVLLRNGFVYPQGRMVAAAIKGIDTSQEVVKIPTQLLEKSTAEIPALIGKRMAEASKLKVGDQVLMRWRDKNGTFDADNITIATIFDTNVPDVDNGQIWLPYKKLEEMTGLTNQATLFIADKNYVPTATAGWKFQTQDDLLKGMRDLEEKDKMGGYILYVMLLAMALLAVFDTQVLSIFRRQKEIGSYIALGMTRKQVLKLFTVEGSMYSILAVIVGCIIGIPLFKYIEYVGIGMPDAIKEIGLPMAKRTYPDYGWVLIFGTAILLMISVTIVSFMPARKIAKMDPVDALKGKLQ
jgi:putative ABC transport system permease protein